MGCLPTFNNCCTNTLTGTVHCWFSQSYVDSVFSPKAVNFLVV
jgi:hypothetical protein